MFSLLLVGLLAGAVVPVGYLGSSVLEKTWIINLWEQVVWEAEVASYLV